MLNDNYNVSTKNNMKIHLYKLTIVNISLIQSE